MSERPSGLRNASLGCYARDPQLVALGFVGEHKLGLAGLNDRLLRYDAALDIGPGGHLEHRVKENLLDDRPQRPGARPEHDRLVRDRLQRPVLEDQLDVVQRKELLVLPDERVLRFDEYSYDVLLVEAVQGHGDRQPTDELGDEPVLEKILRPQVLEDVRDVLLLPDLVSRHM